MTFLMVPFKDVFNTKPAESGIESSIGFKEGGMAALAWQDSVW